MKTITNHDFEVTLEALRPSVCIDANNTRHDLNGVWLRRKLSASAPANAAYWLLVPFTQLLPHSGLVFGQTLTVTINDHQSFATTSTDYLSTINARQRLVKLTRNKLLRLGKKALRGADLNAFNVALDDLLASRLTTDAFLRLAPVDYRNEVDQLLRPLPDPMAHLRPILWGSRIFGTMYPLSEDAPALPRTKLASDGKPLVRHNSESDLAEQLAYYQGLDKVYHHGQPWVPTAVLLE